MAKIPPGRESTVAAAAWDARCTEIEAADRNAPRQTRWAAIPITRLQDGFVAKVTRTDAGQDARLSTATTAAINRAIDASVGTVGVAGGRVP